MKEHYTKNTVEVSAWCKKCEKLTMHRVDRDTQQGRLGPCLECVPAQKKSVPEPEQLSFPSEDTHDDRG